MKAFLTAVILCLALAGCKEEPKDFRRYVKPRVAETTDHFLQALIGGEVNNAAKLLIPDLHNAEGSAMLSKAVEVLKRSPVISPPPYEIVLYNMTGEVFGAHHEVTYQIQREKAWVLVHIGVDDIYGRFNGVTDIDFRYIPLPLSELHAFSFKGKPWKHYAVLAVCAVISMVVAVSFILLLRTKTRKRWIWWVWCFFIFIGFVRASFNWTSGQMVFYPTGGPGHQVLYHLGWVVNVEHNSPYEPWYIQFMLPVGALAFLWRRKSLMARAEEQ